VHLVLHDRAHLASNRVREHQLECQEAVAKLHGVVVDAEVLLDGHERVGFQLWDLIQRLAGAVFGGVCEVEEVVWICQSRCRGSSQDSVDTI